MCERLSEKMNEREWKRKEKEKRAWIREWKSVSPRERGTVRKDYNQSNLAKEKKKVLSRQLCTIVLISFVRAFEFLAWRQSLLYRDCPHPPFFSSSIISFYTFPFSRITQEPIPLLRLQETAPLEATLSSTRRVFTTDKINILTLPPFLLVGM